MEKDKHMIETTEDCNLQMIGQLVFRTCKLLFIAKHNIHSCTIQVYTHSNRDRCTLGENSCEKHKTIKSYKYTTNPRHILQINGHFI